MTVAMVAMHRRLPPGQRGPLPPYHISMAAAERVGMRCYLAGNSRLATTMTLHFAYGTTVGALYVPFSCIMPGRDLPKGLVFGVLVWAGSYLGWLPITGLLSPATRHPAARNALMIVAHLVWGTVIALTVHTLLNENGVEPSRPA